MVIVTLKDGTTYPIDTNSTSKAHMVVEHKLRDRLDFREIISCTIMEFANLSKYSEMYNSDDPYDGKPLVANHGWSYKWD